MGVRMAVPAVYLLLSNQHREILLMRRCNTGYMDGMLALPSGHVEGDELPSRAMIREAKEEINVTILPCDMHIAHICYRPAHDTTGNRVDFYFRATYWQGEVTNAEPDKCSELIWAKPGRLPADVIPHIRQVIGYIERRLAYSELDLEWLKAHGEYALDR